LNVRRATPSSGYTQLVGGWMGTYRSRQGISPDSRRVPSGSGRPRVQSLLPECVGRFCPFHGSIK
jgi:hypothetical protein